MKKAGIILPIIIAIAVILACTLPSSIEIKGTPDVTISARKDISSLFNDEIDNIDFGEDITKLSCSKTDTMTIALYMSIIGEDSDNDIKSALKGEVEKLLTGTQTLDNITDEQLAVLSTKTEEQLFPTKDGDGNESFTLPLDALNDADFIKDFWFRDIPTKMYMYGTKSLMDALRIEIGISGSTSKFGENDSAYTGESGFNPEWKTCEWTALPSHGKNLTLTDAINKKEDLIITYKVYLKANSKPKKEWIENPKVRVELVMMLPLDFIVDPERGADLNFPDDVFGSGDMFSREAGADSNTADIIQSLELNIELDPNPFGGADLVVKSKDGKINKSTPTTSTVNLVFNEADMKKINDPANIPFEPQISFHFNKNGTLKIPRVLKTKSLRFKAKILLKQDLGGNG